MPAKKKKPSIRTRKNVWPMSGTGKGYREVDALPATQFTPYDTEQGAKAAARLFQGQGKVATAEKRGKVWGVSRPQGLSIGDWKKKNGKATTGHVSAPGVKTCSGCTKPKIILKKRSSYGIGPDGTLLCTSCIQKAHKKMNPGPDAEAMYESFHGLPSEEDLTFMEQEHYHSNLAALGTLIELKLKTVNGDRTSLKFPRDTAQNPGPLPGGMSLRDYLFPNRKYVHIKTYPKEIQAQEALGKLEAAGKAGRVDRVGRLPGNYKWELWGLRDAKGKTNGKGKKTKGPFAQMGELVGQATTWADNKIVGNPKEDDIIYEAGPYWVLKVNKVPPGGGKKTVYYEVYEIGITHSTQRYLSGSLDRAKAWADKNAATYTGPFGKGKKSNPDDANAITILCSNEEGTQLYFIGGDQSVPLMDLGFEGPAATKETILIGSVTNITYHTTKKFGAKPETYDYIHKFSEDSNGPLPQLVYDRLNERLSLVGGVYYIEKPMLGTSPGIED